MACADCHIDKFGNIVPDKCSNKKIVFYQSPTTDSSSSKGRIQDDDSDESSEDSENDLVDSRDTSFISQDDDDEDEERASVEGESESIHSPPSEDDSGFYSEDAHNLRCLESDAAWSVSDSVTSAGTVIAGKYVSGPGIRMRQATVACRYEDMGFEDYQTDIYRHRRQVEARYHVKGSLEFQKEIERQERNPILAMPHPSLAKLHPHLARVGIDRYMNSLTINWQKTIQLTPGMRGVLVSWLTTVHHRHQLCQDTLFLTVNIVDRCLKVMHVSHDCFQLLGVTALLIASKHEEITPPEITDLLWLCGESFTRGHVVELEKLVLAAIGFDLFIPSAYLFLEYFAFWRHLGAKSGVEREKCRQCEALSRYTLEISLQDYKLCQYPLSILGFSAVKIAEEEYDIEVARPTQPVDQDLPLQPNLLRECLTEYRTLAKTLTQNFPEMSELSSYYMRS